VDVVEMDSLKILCIVKEIIYDVLIICTQADCSVSAVGDDI
jgi:hypothetical protein